MPPTPQQANSQSWINQNQPQAPQGESWWQKLLPTAGGILGGLAGEAIDPFGGGIPGAALGVGLAGVGGAAGKAAENASQGQNPLQGNDLTSGIENAAGMGIGGVLGKIGTTVAGNVIKPAAENLTTSLVKGQFANGTIDKTVADYLKTNGITDARQVADIAPNVTGSNGVLSQGVRTGLQASDNGIDITGLDKIAQDAITNEVGLKSTTQNDINTILQNNLKKMVGEDAQSIPAKTGMLAGRVPATTVFAPGSMQNVLPENAFTGVQDFERAASQQYQKAFDKAGNVINNDAYGAARVFNQLADNLESRTFGVGQEAMPLTNDAKQAMLNSPQMQNIASVNPVFHESLSNQIANTANLQDLRPLQSNMVQASKGWDATQNIANRGGGATAADIASTLGRGTSPIATVLAAGTPHGFPALLAGMALKSPAVDRGAASLASNVAQVAGSSTANKLIPLLSKIGTIGAANAPNYASAPQGGTMQPGTQPGIPGAAGGAGGAQGAATLSNGQPINNADLLSQLDQMLTADPFLASSLIPAIQQLAAPVQATNAAQAALGGYQNTLGAAGGAQGPVGGGLSALGGAVTGGPASQVGTQQSILQALLAKAGISNAAMPGLYANPQGAGAGMGNVQSILSAMGAQ